MAYGRWGEAQPEAARQRARSHRGAGFHIGFHDVLQHLARAIVETLDRRGLGDGVQWLRHRLFSGPFFQVQAPLPECSDPPGRGQRGAQWALRSEEHTSELQSLMRISYAVFCLNKQINTTSHDSISPTMYRHILQ